jgi:GWxTD domain-containing protein
MKKPALLLFLWLAAQVPVTGQSAAAPPAGPRDLDLKYQTWLKVVSYIILPQEREVFLKLTNDRDRDIFIQNFWGLRDPTPGTAANEYREEHQKRFDYANRQFRRGAGREGWMTDMGRVHIILGEPVSYERFEGTLDITPCVAWTYYGDPKKGLPNHFILLFYQRGGAGEYKLYDPFIDGPDSLLRDKRGLDPTDYADLYDRIRERAPTLADIAISIVPGEYNPDLSPSARNSIILASILESPKRDVNPSYATHFLEYKGLVSTEYLTNFIDSESCVSLFQDPATGLRFLHFSIAPKRLSFDFYEPKDQYYCSFKMDVSLRDGEKIIYQYPRDLPFYFAKADYGRIQANGISFEDSIPVVEGRLRLTVLLRNEIGKGFSLVEHDVTVPEEGSQAGIEGPFVGYGAEPYPADVHMPYKVHDTKILVDPGAALAPGDQLAYAFAATGLTEALWQKGSVQVRIKGQREDRPYDQTFRIPLAEAPFRTTMGFNRMMPAKDLPPDYYDLQLSLFDGDQAIIDQRSAAFVVSAAEAVPHPIANFRGLPLANRFLYYYIVAEQHNRLGRTEKAAAAFQRAYELNPAYLQGIAEYARFLVKAQMFEQALPLIAGLKDADKHRFEYFLLQGQAEMGLGRYEAAAASLERGNRIYDSDTNLLNALGLCYMKTGQKERALAVFKASLRLNANQPAIQKLMAEVGKTP